MFSAYAGANSGGNFVIGVLVYSMQADASASFDDFITIYGGTGGGTVETIGSFECCHHFDAVPDQRQFGRNLQALKFRSTTWGARIAAGGAWDRRHESIIPIVRTFPP